MKTEKVAVYGTLLTGERNFQVGAAAVSRIACRLSGTLYDTGWGFPAYVPRGETEIVAELLEVDEAGMRRLDRLEGYPDLYGRRKVAVRLMDGTADTAWVYIMKRLPDRARPIREGDWARWRKEHGR